MPEQSLSGTRQIFFAASGILVLLCLLAVLNPVVRTDIENAYEDVTFALSPSAALAYAYGERHFDAKDPNAYNINRAEHFFTIAAAKDPSIPYLFHELARISFLRGNFAEALAQINLQISLHGDSEPNAYYVRGLIEGYMGAYDLAEADYAHYLTFDPKDWAALNDYSWVLIKDKKYEAANETASRGLADFPLNPWLLNSRAIARFEMGSTTAALEDAGLASSAASIITEADWLKAYPGNDPRIAAQGVATLRSATLDTMHSIEAAIASSTVE